jgi:hypothetical protein
VALRDKWTEFATAAMGFINSSDAGNSRKGEPTAEETAQLTMRLEKAKSQIPGFLKELEAFMKEVNVTGSLPDWDAALQQGSQVDTE